MTNDPLLKNENPDSKNRMSVIRFCTRKYIFKVRSAAIAILHAVISKADCPVKCSLIYIHCGILPVKYFQSNYINAPDFIQPCTIRLYGIYDISLPFPKALIRARWLMMASIGMQQKPASVARSARNLFLGDRSCRSKGRSSVREHAAWVMIQMAQIHQTLPSKVPEPRNPGVAPRLARTGTKAMRTFWVRAANCKWPPAGCLPMWTPSPCRWTCWVCPAKLLVSTETTAGEAEMNSTIMGTQWSKVNHKALYSCSANATSGLLTTQDRRQAHSRIYGENISATQREALPWPWKDMAAASSRNAEKIITQDGYDHRRATVTCPTRVLVIQEGVTRPLSTMRGEMVECLHSSVELGIQSVHWNSPRNWHPQSKLPGVQWSHLLFPTPQVGYCLNMWCITLNFVYERKKECRDGKFLPSLCLWKRREFFRLFCQEKNELIGTKFCIKLGQFPCVQ